MRSKSESRGSFRLSMISWAMIAATVGFWAVPKANADRPPNLVLIFIDDMGYGDIAPFGGDIPTPNLDRMALEGRRFTDFCVSSAVCSASRAALLTGCYHARLGITGALSPNSKIGLDSAETTIADLCKANGYATACFGKWHLGDDATFLPTAQGFDEYYGIPYSNDMWPLHPTAKQRAKNDPNFKMWPELPMIEATSRRGVRVVNADLQPADQRDFTTEFTRRAVEFIEDNAEQPFFVYLPHPMVHVPLYVSDKFAGKSGKGLFGDVVMEVDWSVGQILDKIRDRGLQRNTLVIFTSDNGPWLSYGNHAGTAGQFREGKGTMFEGGVREPTLMWWPGTVPAGTSCDKLASTIDLLPTMASLIGGSLPDAEIDGHDITPLIVGQPDATSPHESFVGYYGGGQLQTIRDERFKLVFPHRYRTLNGHPGGIGGRPIRYQYRMADRALYDLDVDPGESTNVIDDHPEVVARLEAAAETYRKKFGDKLNGQKGSDVRGPGRLEAVESVP